jgi:glutamate/tyrosine decarboxylase-like PLP-dependent enzyme
MAMFAYREYMMKERGVIKPNIVICETGHAAAIKAAHYFDLEIKMIPFDSNYQMHLGKMKRAIDENTICVYTSYPNYPIGSADQIDDIGPYCQRKGIPVHVDMCLGGFVAPLSVDNWKLPEGITSVSADNHKYGLSAKGVSILLFSS